MADNTKPRFRVSTTDGLANMLSGMGTNRDQRQASFWQFGNIYNDWYQLEAAYSENWIARAVIDNPVEDATREWLSYNHDSASDIDKHARQMKLQAVIQGAFKWSGLYGGAGILMVTDQPLDRPLNVNRIKKGSLKKLLPLDRMYITGSEFNYTDILADNFMHPEYYLVYGGTMLIHSSHFVRAPGAQLPMRLRQLNGGWDDSQLRRCMEDLNDAVAAKGGIAKLIQEANVDVITNESLKSALAAGDSDVEMGERYRLFGMMKSMFRIALLSGEETYERKGASFGGLGEVLSTMMEWTAGAARQPMTRLFGVQSKGMGDTGQGDTTNYYDSIRSRQENDYRPVIEQINQVLVRSALGSYPEDLNFEFNPLSQPSENEVAQQNLANAQADEMRIAQGVVRRSQVARKLKEQAQYAIGDDDIERLEQDEQAEFEGGSRLPDAASIFGGGESESEEQGPPEED
ncbi:DUF1073 domain-containing protein [Carnimonas bestiolae]|uniref:DUF1073 domain-containing protein n=1 Tax=Carnimonas bestiolae TaxID=3402172 RepID=UPI003EDBC586